MADVFVSYASEDRDRIIRIVEAIEQSGFTVWWDRRISLGNSFDREIERELDAARCVVVVWSTTSIGSDWVRNEAQEGLERGILVPLLIDDVRPPLAFRRAQTASISDTPTPDELVRILEAIESTIRPELPGGLRLSLGLSQAVMKHDLSTADYERKIAETLDGLSKPREAVTEHLASRRPKWPALSAAAITALTVAALAGWWLTNNARVSQVLAIEVPEIIRLADAGEYVAAYRIAIQAEPFVRDHPLFVAQWERITSEISITTNPEAARVSFKPYGGADSEWEVLGETPINSVRLPRGAFRWRFEKPGYQTRVIAARVADPSTEAMNAQLGRDWATINIELMPKDESLPGMVVVSGRRENVDSVVPLPLMDDFMIDETEVTNADFQEFVDTGGYERAEFWSEPFVRNGKSLKFDEAMAFFRDKTGRPGPATWSMSSFPRGTENLPVGGVSWYEAAAYAEFRHKTLPTLHHWQRAALHDNDWLEPLTPLIVRQSNFAGEKPVAAGSSPAISAYGAYDMAGNVAEWVWNESSNGERYLMGGSWPDAPVIFAPHVRVTASPWSRQPTHGFRCAKYPGGSVAETLLYPLEMPELTDYRAVPARPAHEFEAEALLRMYDETPLNAAVESVEPSPYGGRYERVSVDAAYSNERLLIDLHLPHQSRPPYQAVVWVGAGGRVSLDRAREEAYLDATDFFVQSGRVLVNPILAGTYERQGEDTVADRFRTPNQRRAILAQWTQDVRRTLDYLEAREDIDGSRVAFAAVSGGALYGISILPHEPRFRAATLWGLGFFGGNFYSPMEFTDLVRRISIPVLMLNGTFDPLLSVEKQVEPMFGLFGAPEADKRLVVFEASHWPYPHDSVIKESLDWLDRYLGPVPSARK